MDSPSSGSRLAHVDRTGRLCMSVWRWLVAVPLGLLLSVSPALAQQGTGELRGRVLDEQGAVLPGVAVIGENEATGQFRESVIGDRWLVLHERDDAGRRTKSRPSSPASRSTARRDVRVEVGKTFASTSRCRSAAWPRNRSPSPASRRWSTRRRSRSAARVTSQEFERHAVDQSQLHDLSRHAAGRGRQSSRPTRSAPTRSASTDRARRTSTTRSTAPATTTRSTAATAARRRSTPVEAVQEFQLLTSQFDAEFGPRLAAWSTRSRNPART